MKRDSRKSNNFAIARDRLQGAVYALGGRGAENPNLDIVAGVLQHDLEMPDILCSHVCSFSQHGEDVILLGILRAVEILPGSKPSILELGSNHPINMSNTWLLYQEGYKSVLVDANERYEADTLKTRPNDIFLCAGVTPGSDVEANLYVPQHAELASFSRTFVTSWYERRGWTAEIREVCVPLYHINDLLSKYFEPPGPTLLSIDLEGMDFDILQAMDWEAWKPAVICMERSTRARSAIVIERFLNERGYQKLVATLVNDIFVRSDLASFRPPPPEHFAD